MVKAIEVIYDIKIISYSELLDYYWKQFNATDTGGSFYIADTTQKRLAGDSKKWIERINIFKKPITVKVVKMSKFMPVVESEKYFYIKDPTRYNEYRTASGRYNYIKVSGVIYNLISIKN